MSDWSYFLFASGLPDKRRRGRPRKPLTDVLGYGVGRQVKKPSGGQAKYDVTDLDRWINEHIAERGLPSRRAALCDLLFYACHTAKSPALQAKARAMDEKRAWFEKRENLPPARLIVRVVQEVEGDKLKAVEELLRKHRKRTR